MSKYVFLYKGQSSDDRDCVKYIDISRLGKLECGHYFPSIGTHGACYSMGLDIDGIDFEDITSALNKDEFLQLDAFNTIIEGLGHGITHGDERYLKGIEAYNNIRHILDKLQSDENAALFEQVQQEEKEYLMEEYSLDEEEADFVFDNYGLDYRDRGIVSYIWNDIDEAAEEEAEAMGYATRENERYFNYEEFGRDLLEGESYVEMPGGRVIRYNY